MIFFAKITMYKIKRYVSNIFKFYQSNCLWGDNNVTAFWYALRGKAFLEDAGRLRLDDEAIEEIQIWQKKWLEDRDINILDDQEYESD